MVVVLLKDCFMLALQLKGLRRNYVSCMYNSWYQQRTNGN